MKKQKNSKAKKWKPYKRRPSGKNKYKNGKFT